MKITVLSFSKNNFRKSCPVPICQFNCCCHFSCFCHLFDFFFNFLLWKVIDFWLFYMSSAETLILYVSLSLIFTPVHVSKTFSADQLWFRNVSVLIQRSLVKPAWTFCMLHECVQGRFFRRVNSEILHAKISPNFLATCKVYTKILCKILALLIREKIFPFF